MTTFGPAMTTSGRDRIGQAEHPTVRDRSHLSNEASTPTPRTVKDVESPDTTWRRTYLSGRVRQCEAEAMYEQANAEIQTR